MRLATLGQNKIDFGDTVLRELDPVSGSSCSDRSSSICRAISSPSCCAEIFRHLDKTFRGRWGRAQATYSQATPRLLHPAQIGLLSQRFLSLRHCLQAPPVVFGGFICPETASRCDSSTVSNHSTRSPSNTLAFPQLPTISLSNSRDVLAAECSTSTLATTSDSSLSLHAT